MDKLSELSPKIGQWAKQAQPYLQKIEPFLRAAYPYCHLLDAKVREVHRMLLPYYQEEAMEIAVALVLLFFGGHFALTVACWQAFRVSGSRLISKSWCELVESYRESKLALEKDEEARRIFDADGSGSIGPGELISGLRAVALAKTEEERLVARKKILLVMKCIDPNKILDASLGLWAGIVAVLATLRSRFVHCIGIGASVGQRVAETITPLVQPSLYEMFPQQQKWVDFGLRASAAGAGVVTSLVLIRVISAFNSAFQGAAMLVSSLTSLATKKQWLKDAKLTEDQTRLAIWFCALAGFLWQIQTGFNLPVLVKVPLTPLYLMEYSLSIVAAI